MSALFIPNPGGIFNRRFIYQDCLNVELLLHHSETPEAYPLIYRQKQVENWRQAFPYGDLLALWIGCAIYITNHIKNAVDRSRAEKFFTCIAFSMYEPDDEGTLIPKIYVAEKKRRHQIMSTCRKVMCGEESPDVMKIKSAFRACGIAGEFSFYESRFADPSGEGTIIWLYCIQSE